MKTATAQLQLDALQKRFDTLKAFSDAQRDQLDECSRAAERAALRIDTLLWCLCGAQQTIRKMNVELLKQKSDSVALAG